MDAEKSEKVILENILLILKYNLLSEDDVTETRKVRAVELTFHENEVVPDAAPREAAAFTKPSSKSQK